MLYESDIRCAKKDKNHRDTFFKLMEMYLKSRSLHSYLIKKDLNGIYTVPAWRDPFVWWYIRREKFFTVFLIAVLSCTLCAAITYALCSSIFISLCIIISIVAFHIFAITILKEAIDHFGKTDVPNSISGINQIAPFKFVDDMMTEQELKKML